MICVAFSYFTASVLNLLKIKRSLTHLTLDKMILLILITPGRLAILQVSYTVSHLNRRISSAYISVRAAVFEVSIILLLNLTERLRFIEST